MGWYITLEGPEATGKSTQAELLAKELATKYPDKEILLTKEPGSPHNPVNQQIRQILLDPTNIVGDKTALLLFLADRAQHIEYVVKPVLQQGGIVISDRSSLSTVIYHTAKMLLLEDSSHISHDYFYEMIDFAQECRPDFCFIANADFKWCAKRLAEREGLDRIEGMGEQLHRNIHELFHEIATHQIPYSNNYIFGIRARMQNFPKKIMLLPSCHNHSKQHINRAMMNALGDFNG